MHTIFTISQREITRLRSHFKGSARPVMFLLLAGSFLLAYIAFQQGAVRGRGLYRVGVSPDTPPIADSRFVSLVMSPDEGAAMLEAGTLNAYIHGATVTHNEDAKSLNAIGALELYLENEELARIADEYDEEQAFPLRVAAKTFPIEIDSETRTFIPSLMRPPLPFEQVLVVALYLMPISLVSVFFTSGFMDEKTDRRITVLLSSPVTPLHIILGKMLPYFVFALLSVVVLTLILGGKVLLALLIFTPVILFSFSIYLMVPLIYRTFKDTTFISMLATTVITTYLIFPAMFVGVNDLSVMSPLSLAVKMYRNQSFDLREYFTATISMYLIFALAVYVGCRILNEEYLMKYRAIYRKLADALYLMLNRQRPYLSILLLSLCLVPLVYMVQLAVLTIALNLPIRYAVGALLVMSIVIEEIAKSAGIVVLLENKDIVTYKHILLMAVLSAIGFLIGEKLLLFFSISIVSESMLSAVLFNAGKLWIPLLAHFTFTSIITTLTRLVGPRWYFYTLSVGVIIHTLYNLTILGVI